MWSCQNKKETKSLSNLLITTSKDNDFYTPLWFYSFKGEADTKQNNNAYTAENTTTQHTVLQQQKQPPPPQKRSYKKGF